MNNLLKGINLYLVAMPGAGKTTVGRLLAKQLGYGFIDTDEVIVKAVGQPISQMFAEQGEAEFRLLESKVLAQICAIQKLVVATGGGIILRRENWSYLHHGLVVWLDAAVDILYSRLVEDTTRPLLQDPDPKAKLRSLLEQRQPLYAQADLRITITEGETPEEISTRVLEAIPSVLKKPDSLPNGC
ncbi:shikimate kinase [Chlorogloeopsis fritschii PCC 9212]|uniref:Shikimate kinase n=1 Tax=Chlorogloeopsis fritschii PCC 6912 TaxID=211165 RepID=A0A3S0XG86_CHLFR|nr:shikimate kinase [Chlorogloeopsis fritschii]MBF2008850.1 shikimate kinase [Chlorogloeopsis fritschii C42_A2020_084]RUR72270.1 shikimate kinase [Chlorogloeopsis fritschii PCC 6912]